MNDELREQLAEWRKLADAARELPYVAPQANLVAGVPDGLLAGTQATEILPYTEAVNRSTDLAQFHNAALAAVPALVDAIAAAIARVEAAEAHLALVDKYASYYAAAWEQFEGDSDGPEPLDFDEWLAAGKPEGAA